MKALILAAGDGRRLRPITDRIPKPMIPIGGKPILEYNVELLVNHGVNEIFINLHHEPDAIREHFGNGSRFGARIVYSYEPELLGTAGAAKRLEQELQGAFVLVYGDNLSTIDINGLRALHETNAAAATIALYEREDVTSSGIVGMNDRGRIDRFLEKPAPQQIFSHWVNAGYICFAERVFAYIPANAPSDFGRDVLPAMLAAGEPLYGYPMREALWWIDSLEDYERTHAEFEQAKKFGKD